jgi:Fe-S-cluster containining protein
MGTLGQALRGLSDRNVDPDDLLDPDAIKVRNPKGKMLMPDCENCTDRCCVHDDPASGILLSLQDIAHLVDAGLGDLIVGRYSFRRNKKGRILDEIDEMPRLAKQPDGNCHFYDPSSGRCNGYGVRPTICRRFPYEVGYKKKSGKPFARFIGWSQCPTLEGPEFETSIAQMARDAVVDENVSYEDAVLLGSHVEELRQLGFDRYLPPPEECPGAESDVRKASA